MISFDLSSLRGTKESHIAKEGESEGTFMDPSKADSE